MTSRLRWMNSTSTAKQSNDKSNGKRVNVIAEILIKMVVNAPGNQSSLPKDIYVRNIKEWITDIHKALEHLCPYCQQNSVISMLLGIIHLQKSY